MHGLFFANAVVYLEPPVAAAAGLPTAGSASGASSGSPSPPPPPGRALVLPEAPELCPLVLPLLAPSHPSSLAPPPGAASGDGPARRRRARLARLAAAGSLPRTPFYYFLVECRELMREEAGQDIMLGELTEAAGEMWAAMGAEERWPYNEIARSGGIVHFHAALSF